MIAQCQKVQHVQSAKVLCLHLNVCLQHPVQLIPNEPLPQRGSACPQLRCTSLVDTCSVRLYQAQRVFLAGLLLSSHASQRPVLKFKFDSWVQMVHFQTIIAEVFGLDKIEDGPHNAKSREKRRSIVVRYLEQRDPAGFRRPIPIVRRPEPQKGESTTEKWTAAMFGLVMRRSQVHHLPQAYLDQARQLLLLNKKMKPCMKECIRLSIANEYGSLLPDRPRWMQVPYEPIWPGKCRIRAGAEPTGYRGRLWSKKKWLDRKKKASEAESLPMNILKQKFRKQVENALKNTGHLRRESHGHSAFEKNCRQV